jgi:Pyrrolo-quinoline quinone coenzyme N-terminus.
MRLRKLLLATSLALAPVLLLGQGQAQQGGLDPATILKPLADSWPTYSGDYTGRRYSALTQIKQTNVKGLTLAWIGKVTAGPGDRKSVV